MKKLFVLFLSLALVLIFCSCGVKRTPSGVIVPKDDGIVDNIVINGEEVSAVDFVTESCNNFIQSEKYLAAYAKYTENYEAEPFEVTRVLDLKAYGLGPNKLNIHYMLIKATCCWADGEDFFAKEITLVADYDTGEVWSSFDCDESWQEDGEAKEYWTWVMLNSCFTSSAYVNDAFIGDDLETRAEFTAEDIAAVNAGIKE